MASSPEPEDDEVIVVEDDDSLGDRWGVHCAATWKIGNYSCCQLECGEELFSPLLSADSSGKVKWYLSIFPNGQAEFEEYVSICVVFIRSSSEAASTNGFRASCKVSIIDSESNVWMCDRKDQNLSRFQFDAFVRREQLFAAKDTVIPQDTLTVRCQISVFDPRASRSNEEVAHPSTTERLRSYADDFKKLYESRKFSDVTLETRDGDISAHKVILSARSPVFAEHFRESRATYPLPTFDKGTAEVLMAYVYSGRTEPAVPSLLPDLYDMAQTFQLRELAGVLTPNQISVQTEVTNEEFSYTMRVKNFSGFGGGGRQKHSETFHTGPSSRAWSLSLCLKKVPDDDGDQHLAVSLKKLRATGDEKAIYVRFSVCLLDREQQASHAAEASKLYKLGGRHGFPSFVRRSAVLRQAEDLLPADTLTVRCDMRICDGASSSRLQHSFHSRRTRTGDEEEERLSACLRGVLRGGRDCDVTVCATDREFRLHRCVLCARSTVFADFFDRYSDSLSNYTINIQGIRAEILELFFAFVYTGKLDEGVDLTCRTAPELFAAADHYKISDLKAACSEFMMRNVCEILVRVGQTTSAADSKVRELVKDFVCSNAEEVMVSDQWSELVREHPRLASDILKSLARGYQEAKRRRVE